MGKSRGAGVRCLVRIPTLYLPSWMKGALVSQMLNGDAKRGIHLNSVS